VTLSTFAKATLAYPSSFREVLLVGFALIVLPLITVLAYATWNTRRYVEQSHEAVILASQIERASRSLVNRVGSIERLAGQIAVTDSKELRADYARVHGAFRGVYTDLARLPLEEEQRIALELAMAQEGMLHRLLTAEKAHALNLGEIGERTAQLTESAAGVLAISFLAAEREVERLRESAQVVQGKLIVMVVFGAALSLLIVLSLTRQIARPIAQLEFAILQLGDGDFSRPVRVSGPKDLQAVGQRLDWLRRRLLEFGAEKDRFLRHLSHELKTPLTAVREGSDLLSDEVAGPLSPRQRQVVSILRGNSLKLQRLIEHLLEHQRALHSAATLRLQPVNLGVLIRDTVHAHRLAVSGRGQSLVFELEPISLSADKEKLSSIIDNLVGNAVKFCPRGGTIEVITKRRGDTVTIDVCDSGSGIPPDERDPIFDSYFRGRLGSGGQVQGTGLGLAIVREYVEAHGGRVHVVEESRGGHFRVTLPFDSMTSGVCIAMPGAVSRQGGTNASG